jgi:cytochrome c oxidase subunit 2
MRACCVGVAALVISSFGCRARPPIRVDAVDVRLVAQDTSWHASYVLGSAQRATEVPTGREVHVPLGADVRLALTSRDYISDFRVPELGLRDFAAPELPSEFRFRADRVGRYSVRGDELCGLPHTDRARGTLVVEDSESFRAWVRKRTEGMK